MSTIMKILLLEMAENPMLGLKKRILYFIMQLILKCFWKVWKYFLDFL